MKTLTNNDLPHIRSRSTGFRFAQYSIFDIRYSIFFFLFSFLLLFSHPLPAQEWSDPMNITNLGGYSMDPDMVIDHSGVIHVVWSYRIEDWYWKIMYTCSEDDGSTWAEPLDLLQNTDLWMSQPHIACDSKNHLYVTYSYNTMSIYEMLIKMVVYDGHQWSDPILVSEEMPGSDYSKIITNNNNQIFLGWYKGGKFYYRFYCDPIFSEIYCPYCNEVDKYLPVEGAITLDQEIHWVGSSASANYYGARLQYYLFDISINGWSEPQMLVQDTVTDGKDIALNSGELPECTYRKVSEINYNVFDSTKHIKKEVNYWSDPELVAGVDGNQKYQQIAVDQNNDVHVVEQQNAVEGYGLVHYKNWNNNWIGQFIDTSYIVRFPKLLFKGNKLYCAYSKTWEIEKEVDSDLFFTKYDIITGQKEQPTGLPNLKIYPNPGRDNIYIEFENKKEQPINLSIFDINGKHIITLINETKPRGVYRELWNGTDKNGKEANSGSYLVRLKSGRKTVTQTVELIK